MYVSRIPFVRPEEPIAGDESRLDGTLERPNPKLVLRGVGCEYGYASRIVLMEAVRVWRVASSEGRGIRGTINCFSPGCLAIKEVMIGRSELGGKDAIDELINVLEHTRDWTHVHTQEHPNIHSILVRL